MIGGKRQQGVIRLRRELQGPAMVWPWSSAVVGVCKVER
jgi:hypothetical protein